MHIQVNGQQQYLAEPISVEHLLQQLGLLEKRIAVEVNQEILSRERFPTTRLNDGDIIEIVQAIGGG